MRVRHYFVQLARVIALSALPMVGSAWGGSVADVSSTEILGLPWGATDVQVEAKYPGGTRGLRKAGRYYQIADGRSFLGVERSESPLLEFRFNAENRLMSMWMHYPPSTYTRDRLTDHIEALFGPMRRVDGGAAQWRMTAFDKDPRLLTLLADDGRQQVLLLMVVKGVPDAKHRPTSRSNSPVVSPKARD